MNSVLPQGWTEVELAELRRNEATRVDPSSFPGEEFELWSVPSFESRQPERRVPGSAIGSDKQSVVPGTVLVCKINPRINRVWVVGRTRGARQIASSEWIPFFPVTGLDPHYLAFYLQQSVVRGYLAANVSGVGGSLMRVRPAVVDRIRFPLPPDAEQRRIVAAIEEHLSRLDAAVAGLKRVQAQLPRYRAAVLKAAVEGRLVPAEERQWKTLPLGEVAEVQLGKMLSPKSRLGVGARPYLRNLNVRWGSLDLTDVLYMDFDEREVRKYWLSHGDLLVCEGGEPGRCAVWKEQHPGMLYQKALHRVRTRGDLDPHFLGLQLRSAASAGTLDKHFTGSTIKHLPREALLRFRVAVPPIADQQRIVAEADRHFSLADDIEGALHRQKAKANALRQSILRRAFAGQLVPQDPNDEPASVLLERIRAGRAKQVAKGGKGRGQRPRS